MAPVAIESRKSQNAAVGELLSGASAYLVLRATERQATEVLVLKIWHGAIYEFEVE